MRRIALIGAFLAPLITGGADAPAADAGAIVVSDAWARASAGPARTGAAYMTIANTGTDDDRLVSAATTAAKSAMLHATIMDGGVMKMRHMDTVAVKAGGTVVLAPGGVHLMLMGLKAPLREGARFPVTLTFERAGTVTLEVEIKGVGAKGPGGMDPGRDHGDHPMKR